MKIDMMSIADAVQLRERLDCLISAAQVVEGVAPGVIIDLTPGRPVTIQCAWAMPAQAVEAGGDSTIAVVVSDDAAMPPRAEASVPLVRGPLSREERQTIRDMAAQGKALSQVATRLNRAAVAVATAYKVILADVEAQAATATEVEDIGPIVVEPPIEVAPCVPAADPLGTVSVREADPEDAVQTAPNRYLDLPLAQRELAQDLDRQRMPKNWSAAIDLDLAEAIARGHKLHVAAADIGVDTGAAQTRYSSLTRSIRDHRNRVTIDGQAHLLAELRRRVRAAMSLQDEAQ